MVLKNTLQMPRASMKYYSNKNYVVFFGATTPRVDYFKNLSNIFGIKLNVLLDLISPCFSPDSVAQNVYNSIKLREYFLFNYNYTNIAKHIPIHCLCQSVMRKSFSIQSL